MKKLNIKELVIAAKEFCTKEDGVYREEFFGVTDGKKVGTIVEHLFQDFLRDRYEIDRKSVV